MWDKSVGHICLWCAMLFISM